LTDWEFRKQEVWCMYRDGQQIVDSDGQPARYASEAQARYTAEHWEDFRTPLLAEVRAMPEQTLRARAAQFGRRIAERALLG
jgi:hypothetical protein